MTRWSLSQCALSLSVAAALLAACGGSQLPIGAPGSVPLSNRVAPLSYKVVLSFGYRDGAGPLASLIGAKGVLYGTTYMGGMHEGGTVFDLSTSGTERVLYSFYGHGPRWPEASLIDVGGTLYGTTAYGGGAGHGCFGHCAGTVFSMSTSGKLHVLHRFSGPDGGQPEASLINVGGTLYGTTLLGGHYRTSRTGTRGFGTVFSITPGKTEQVVHSFGSSGSDGEYPVASLIDVGGTLYGTTEYGGLYACHTGPGCGTVFSLTAGGAEHVLHSFGSGSDGEHPVAGLINVSGTLYGTTKLGGMYNKGTVFSISTSGSEQVLHSFAGGGDGAYPFAGLIDVDGTLYGTTNEGGTYTSKYPNGEGTVFSISRSGSEQVLHAFNGGPDSGDGAYPFASLIKLDGKLYGTTAAGGQNGQGSVFALTP